MTPKPTNPQDKDKVIEQLFLNRVLFIGGENEGRAYAKGSIYGSPVSVELSYQDEGRTLKVFVKALNNKKGS